jgi:hypothetical protein
MAVNGLGSDVLTCVYDSMAPLVRRPNLSSALQA